jgi:hypothetical protein
MVERAPEIEQLLRDTLGAMERGDLETIERLTSREDCVVGIGSDPSEWGEGREENMQLLRESMPEGELKVKIALDDVAAYREGRVGWAAGRGSFEVEGQRVPVRLTIVVHEEDGEWKSVQSHASIGVPNERMFDAMFHAVVDVP